MNRFYNDFDKKVKSHEKGIRNSQELGEENKQLLLKYMRDMKVNNLKGSRICKVISHLRPLGRELGKSFERADEEDVKDMVAWIHDRDLADPTKRDYKVVLKSFYKWLQGNGEYPEKVEWINTTRKYSNNKLPEDLLTEEDVKELIEAAENPRDKAFISLLWETGARIGEIIDLKVGSFEDREHGLKVVIHGKTGARRLPLMSSVPHVNNWKTNHPKKDDSEAPFWCKLAGKNAGEQVSYRYMRKMLKEVSKKAGLDKPTNPHHFRHSRATYLANRFTEAQMCEWFGWVQGSDRPSEYVHLSGRDIDNAYDKLHGIESEEEPDKSEMAPEKCSRCGELNDSDAKFCQKCGQALTPEAFEEKEEARESADELMSKLLEDEEVQEFLKKKLKELQ